MPGLRATLQSKQHEQKGQKKIGLLSGPPVPMLSSCPQADGGGVPGSGGALPKRKPKDSLADMTSMTDGAPRRIGVIAMKSVAKGPWPAGTRTHNCWYQPFDAQKEIGEALRFTLSQHVATAASSSGTRIAELMIDAAERFTPMNEREQEELLLGASVYTPLFGQCTILSSHAQE